ncbi:hypothetical protein [Methanococcus voltae]|uniref:hypothetical protein n=1 Tax=Methanococcus voltae TaxID=2188 RepID=UPI0012F644EC|nr:hypothetical protein [Methanococcus voltae]MCS3901650.1 hypothetical protein [Methanococcus voltae]
MAYISIYNSLDYVIHSFNKPTYMEPMDDLAMIEGSNLKQYYRINQLLGEL